MAAAAIGADVLTVDLYAYADADIDFEARWWGDALKSVPRVVGSVECVVTNLAGATLVDLSPMFVLIDNSAVLHWPDAGSTVGLTPGHDALWRLTLVEAVTGEAKRVASGRVIVSA
jgi:hypothetical protein